MIKTLRTLRSIAMISLLFSAIVLPAPVHAATRFETGISTSSSLLWINNADLEKRLTDIKSLGATWIRVDFSWAAIQPDSPTKYDWKKYDRVVAAAGAHQLKVLAILEYTPAWAREPRCKALVHNEKSAQKCSPRSSEEFARFARAAVLRYSRLSVRGWEIWNEPNLSAYWKTMQTNDTSFVDPVAYARVANAAAYQIRQHTDAAIVTGGLSPLFEPSRTTGMRQGDYLAQLLPHLDINLFDGVGIHPYSWPLLPSRAVSYNAFYTVDNGSSDQNLRAIMDNAGWRDRQLWGTEYGASTKGMRPPTRSITKYNRPDHVTEDVQAQIVTQGMEGWYVKQNVGPLFVHSDSDQWLYKQKNEAGFGLRRSDGSKKPAYDALKEATVQLRGTK